jgi:hypothetical protein
VVVSRLVWCAAVMLATGCAHTVVVPEIVMTNILAGVPD